MRLVRPVRVMAVAECPMVEPVRGELLRGAGCDRDGETAESARSASSVSNMIGDTAGELPGLLAKPVIGICTENPSSGMGSQ